MHLSLSPVYGMLFHNNFKLFWQIFQNPNCLLTNIWYSGRNDSVEILWTLNYNGNTMAVTKVKLITSNHLFSRNFSKKISYVGLIEYFASTSTSIYTVQCPGIGIKIPMFYKVSKQIKPSFIVMSRDWPTYYRWHFKINFLWKIKYFVCYLKTFFPMEKFTICQL